MLVDSNSYGLHSGAPSRRRLFKRPQGRPVLSGRTGSNVPDADRQLPGEICGQAFNPGSECRTNGSGGQLVGRASDPWPASRTDPGKRTDSPARVREADK